MPTRNVSVLKLPLSDFIPTSISENLSSPSLDISSLSEFPPLSQKTVEKLQKHTKNTHKKQKTPKTPAATTPKLTAPPISIISAAAFHLLMKQGEATYSLNLQPVVPEIVEASLWAVGGEHAPYTSLHKEPLPEDEQEMLKVVVPKKYHEYIDIFT